MHMPHSERRINFRSVKNVALEGLGDSQGLPFPVSYHIRSAFLKITAKEKSMRLKMLAFLATFLAGVLVGTLFSPSRHVRAQGMAHVYVTQATRVSGANVAGEPIGFSCVPNGNGDALCHVLSVVR